MSVYNTADMRAAARRNLPRGIFEFIDRGTEDETLLQRNRDGFSQLNLMPSVLIDVSQRSTRTDFMGQPHAMPVAVAPTGAAGLLWHEGELAIAKAAAKANIPFTLATGSMTAMEKLAKEAGGRLWFQLYMWADRSLSHQLVARAQAAGFEGLVVTVDTPVLANREYNARNGFALPFSTTMRGMVDMLAHPGWLYGVLFKYLVTTGMPRYENFPDGQRGSITKGSAKSALMRCDSLTWDDISALRDLWPGTFIIKGILNPMDAVRAFACGADAVVVSNHGGRNIDSAMSTIDILPEVLRKVGPHKKVIVDSGIRRGSDILKALALGAHGVMVGRAPLYGVATSGQTGAELALSMLRNELENMMALCGCSSIADISSDLIRGAPEALNTVASASGWGASASESVVGDHAAIKT